MDQSAERTAWEKAHSRTRPASSDNSSVKIRSRRSTALRVANSSGCSTGFLRQAPTSYSTSPTTPFGSMATHRSEEHTSELQSQSNLVCRLLLEKKNNKNNN